MMANYIFSLWILLVLLAGSGCGPEAETGALFSGYGAHSGAAAPRADTLPPVRAKDALKKSKPAAAAPAAGLSADERSYLLGKFDPVQHPDFTAIPLPYANRRGLYMRKEAFAAFKEMREAARREGLSLTIISAARNFDYQKGIWERKWSNLLTQVREPRARALKILEYSAMPGSSRHHWGTDIDLNDLSNSAFETGGAHARVYDWLHQHAAEYGFCQPYTPKNESRPNGYNEEKWHWSYLPLAGPLLKQYELHITDNMLSGFEGAETAPTIGVVKNYVCGVACK